MLGTGADEPQNDIAALVDKERTGVGCTDQDAIDESPYCAVMQSMSGQHVPSAKLHRDGSQGRPALPPHIGLNADLFLLGIVVDGNGAPPPATVLGLEQHAVVACPVDLGQGDTGLLVGDNRLLTART